VVLESTEVFLHSSIFGLVVGSGSEPVEIRSVAIRTYKDGRGEGEGGGGCVRRKRG